MQTVLGVFHVSGIMELAGHLRSFEFLVNVQYISLSIAG
uniref:Uncharacterized protein n=1 Tax=Anguilla anguilla TaxID=7936 RepID=A0A0E9PU80_ANGAN